MSFVRIYEFLDEFMQKYSMEKITVFVIHKYAHTHENTLMIEPTTTKIAVKSTKSIQQIVYYRRIELDANKRICIAYEYKLHMHNSQNQHIPRPLSQYHIRTHTHEIHLI